MGTSIVTCKDPDVDADSITSRDSRNGQMLFFWVSSFLAWFVFVNFPVQTLCVQRPQLLEFDNEVFCPASQILVPISMSGEASHLLPSSEIQMVPGTLYISYTVPSNALGSDCGTLTTR